MIQLNSKCCCFLLTNPDFLCFFSSPSAQLCLPCRSIGRGFYGPAFLMILQLQFPWPNGKAYLASSLDSRQRESDWHSSHFPARSHVAGKPKPGLPWCRVLPAMWSRYRGGSQVGLNGCLAVAWCKADRHFQISRLTGRQTNTQNKEPFIRHKIYQLFFFLGRCTFSHLSRNIVFSLWDQNKGKK